MAELEIKLVDVDKIKPDKDQRKMTTMRVSTATLERLKKHGDFGDTYDMIINKLLDKIEGKQDQGVVDEQSSQGS